MKHCILLVVIFLLSFSSVHAEEINAGFIQGVWYAHEPVIAGEPTRIYVALRNNSQDDLTSTVRFTDNGERIGVAYVSALPGRIVEAWVDWTPGYGEHTIAASLTNVQLHPIGESPETGEVVNTVAQNAVFVDHDTDKDGVPNQKDSDDDNDGVSDEAETTRGTNPLKADTKPEPEKKEEEPSDVSAVTPEARASTKTATANGLEKYVPVGTTHSVVEALTETIAETKTSLDTYRENRSNEIKDYFMSATRTVTTADGATITRSRTQDDGSFFEAVLRGGKALIGGIYSVILTVLSLFLAHPAILELVLLLLLIYFIYRTARRFGRRRNN